MSSVQRFLRQRATGATLSPVNSTDVLYTLSPGSGNYVGNYANPFLTTTPGVMTSAAAAVVTNAISAGGYYRDMGKTVFAVVGSAVAGGAGTPTTNATPGYFRAVQIITPGYGNGTNGVLPASAFGVGLGINGSGLPNALPSGSNPGDDGYNTYYIPVQVGGVVPSSGTGPLAISPAGIRFSDQL